MLVRAPYIRSFSLHDLMMGSQSWSNSSRIIQPVSMARESQLVYLWMDERWAVYRRQWSESAPKYMHK